MNPQKKKYLTAAVLLNILFSAIGALLILRDHQTDITLYDIPLYSSTGVYDRVGEGSEFHTDYPVSHYRFIGRSGPLLSGIYTITVHYATDQDSYVIHCDSGKADGKPYPLLLAESYTLSSLHNDLSYRIWINSEIDYLDVYIECGEGEEIFETDSSFYLDKIEIARDYKATVCYKFLKILACLILFDAAVCLLCYRKKLQDNIYTVLGLTCIFLVSSLSVMSNYQALGHDSAFHYARIIGLSQGLLGGSFPVKIQPGWLHDYGYAVSVCYGDILLYPSAILYALGVPLLYTYKIYVLIVNAGTLFFSYFCFRKISCHKYIALTCTALYCLSVSRILNLYMRAAVGEYSAFMFLPLIMLGIQRLYDASSEEYFKSGWLFLCLGMTGILQTHILSVEMVCIFIALTVLILIRKMSGRIFISFLKSIFACLLINLGFLVPFLDYAADDLNVFAPKSSHSIQSFGLSIYELFSFNTTAAGRASDSLQGLTERIPESLGLSMLIILLLTCIVLFKDRIWHEGERKRLLLVTGLAGIALWMTTYYFPWNLLADVLFVRNIAASIQFPWRFMSIAVPLLTYAACLVFMKLKEMLHREQLCLLLIGICLISAFQCLFCMDLINRNVEDDSLYYDYSHNLILSRIVSGGEYLLTDTNANLTWIDLDASGQNIQAEILERKGTSMKVACQADIDAWIELPVFAYKYYHCVDTKTGEAFSVTRGTNNKIHVDLPDSYQGILEVSFCEPWHWRLSEIISLVSFLFIVIYTWRKYRHVYPVC